MCLSSSLFFMSGFVWQYGNKCVILLRKSTVEFSTVEFSTDKMCTYEMPPDNSIPLFMKCYSISASGNFARITNLKNAKALMMS